MRNGAASSMTDASPSASRWRIPRRVRSASAEKIASRRSGARWERRVAYITNWIYTAGADARQAWGGGSVRDASDRGGGTRGPSPRRDSPQVDDGFFSLADVELSRGGRRAVHERGAVAALGRLYSNALRRRRHAGGHSLRRRRVAAADLDRRAVGRPAETDAAEPRKDDGCA